MRVCPLCQTKISALAVAARSSDLQCPGCQARLEVAPGSRGLSILAGIVVGEAVWHLAVASYPQPELGWALVVVYSVVALAAVSVAVLMLVADLRVAAAEPAAESAAGGADAGGGHH